jgi:hypothetical protein
MYANQFQSSGNWGNPGNPHQGSSMTSKWRRFITNPKTVIIITMCLVAMGMYFNYIKPSDTENYELLRVSFLSNSRLETQVSKFQHFRTASTK